MARKWMEKVVCDRCGKEFEVRLLERSSWLKPCFVYMKAKMDITGKTRIIERDNEPLDFCHECSESFTKWFDSGKS